MKYEDKNLSVLESIDWGILPENMSSIVKRCYELRRVKLRDLSPDDIRFLIGQEIGLDYLIPMAIKILEKTPYIETLYFSGDLMKNVLQVKPIYWNKKKNQKDEIKCIIDKHINSFVEIDNLEEGSKEELFNLQMRFCQ